MLVLILIIKKIMDLQSKFSNVFPILIDNYTKMIFLNIEIEILIPQRNIDNKDKQSDERYQINMIDDKQSDERDQISNNDE